MLMNNKMCHFPLEFVYLSYTVKKTCLFSSVCIYMCVKIRTVKPGHMLRQYVVLLVFFSLLLLHMIIHPVSYKKNKKKKHSKINYNTRSVSCYLE